MAKYLDDTGVSVLWDKVKAYTSDTVAKISSDDLNLQGVVTCNNAVNLQGVTTYNTLQAVIPSGYDHAIRQYSYENYLDFTDNNADGSYNKTIMRMNGSTGRVECPNGITSQGINLLTGRNVSTRYNTQITLNYIFGRYGVSVENTFGYYTIAIHGTGDDEQWIEVDEGGLELVKYKNLVYAMYSHNDQGDSRLYILYNNAAGSKIYTSLKLTDIYIHSMWFPLQISVGDTAWPS